MKSVWKVFSPLTVSLLLTSSLAAPLATAQNEVTDNPLTELPSQERLLHSKPTGDYTVTIFGERLIGDAYFVFYVDHPKGTIGPESRVTVTLHPDMLAEGQPVGGAKDVNTTFLIEPSQPALAAQAQREPSPSVKNSDRYEARFDGGQGRFVIDNLVFDDRVSIYRIALHISGPLGSGKSDFYLDIYPLKSEAGLGFRLLNLFVPPLLLVGLLLFARRARWRLEGRGSTSGAAESG